MKTFSNDPMKEALALLSFNRGTGNVERDLAAFVNEQNRACSICALTEQSDKLDGNFREESVLRTALLRRSHHRREPAPSAYRRQRPLSSL